MNQRARKKIYYIIILLGIYLIFILNVHKIKFAIGMLSLYSKNKDTNTITETPKDNLNEIKNPLDVILRPDENLNNDIKQPSESSSSEINPTDEKPAKVTNPSIDSKPTIEQEIKSIKPYEKILEEYNPKFTSLQDTFLLDLDSLISQGIIEYNEGSITSTKLMIKYMNEGSKLEKNSDIQFDTLVKSLEKELEDNGHDTSLINDIKNYYKTLKQQKKEDIVNRGMKYVNNNSIMEAP